MSEIYMELQDAATSTGIVCEGQKFTAPALMAWHHANCGPSDNEKIYKNALESIVKHFEYILPNGYEMSSAWTIANEAIKKGALNEMQALTESQYQDGDNPLIKDNENE